MSNRYTKTIRDENTYIKVSCCKIAPGVWNLAIVTSRSKRAMNDFIYGRYRRKSCVRLLGKQTSVSFATLIQCNKFIRRMLTTLPEGNWVQSRPDWGKVEALSKWMKRLGFKPYDVQGTLTYFVKVPRLAAT